MGFRKHRVLLWQGLGFRVQGSSGLVRSVGLGIWVTGCAFSVSAPVSSDVGVRLSGSGFVALNPKP